MKFLFDLFPVILFFTVFKWGGGHADLANGLVTQYLSGLISDGAANAELAPILLATAAAILATIGQVAYLLIRRKKVHGMLWISLLVIITFGGMTIYFHNQEFIMWKPTILYWCFAVALLISELFLKKNIIRTMLEEQVKVPDSIWRKLNLTWTAFFIAMGLLNLFVAFVLFKGNSAAWVNFKLFGCTGLIFVFIVGQTIFLSKYMEEPK